MRRLIGKISKRYGLTKQQREQSKNLARLLVLLAWLETQEAHVYFVPGRVEVDLHACLDGIDTKLCTGMGSDLLEALEAAYLTRAQQTGEFNEAAK